MDPALLISLAVTLAAIVALAIRTGAKTKKNKDKGSNAAIVAGVITPDGAKEAIRRFFRGKSDKVIAMNEKAFDLGYEKGLELQKES